MDILDRGGIRPAMEDDLGRSKAEFFINRMLDNYGLTATGFAEM
jgi:hypothetical protein